MLRRPFTRVLTRGKRWALVAFGVLAWLHPQASWALDPATPLDAFEHEPLTARDGLPSLSVRSILHRADGFVWLATAKGVLSFDGRRVRPLHDDGRHALFADTAIAAMVELPTGHVWMASDGGGGLIGVEARGLHAIGSRQGLPHHFVRALLPDPDGGLWIATAAGLARMQEGRITPYRREAGLPDVRLRALARGLDGTLWVGTARGLARREEDRFVVVGPDMAVHALLIDARQELWVGTAQHGLYRMDSSGELRPVPDLPAKRVTALLQDRDRSIWIGTDQGLFRWNGARFETFGGDHPLARRSIRLLYEDREGTVWVGLGNEHGLVRLNDPVLRRLGLRDGLSSNEVYGVHAATGGGVWVATGAGVNRVVGDRVQPRPAAEGLPSASLRTVLEDAKGRLWVLDGQARLFVQEGRSFRRHAPDERIIAVFLDAQGRAIAVGKTVHLAETSAPYLSVRVPKSRAFHVGSSGRLWMASEARVLRAEGNRTVLQGIVQADVNGTVQNLLEDPSGVVWVAMSEGGLVRLAPGGAQTRYRLFHGLPSERLWSLLDDERGSLWLSTGDGIVRLARDTLEENAANRRRLLLATLHGDTRDGPLAHTDVRGPLAARATDGTLYFASGRGLVLVSPGRERARAVRPVVEQIAVDGVSVAGRGPVRLSSSSRLAVTFTAPVSSRVDRVFLRYRLNGRDDEWVRADATRSAVFERLAPGSYGLAIQARDGVAGVWTDLASELALVVAPPIWRTSWFAALLVAACALAGVGLHRLRVRRTKERLELVVEERNRIARDMHDSLAQAFVAISIQLDGLRVALDQDREVARERLAAAVQAVEAGVADTRRAVRTLRSSSVQSTDLAPGLRAIAEALQGRSAIEVHVEGTPVALSADVEEDLLHLGREAITNAVRHAQARRVEVRLTFEQPQAKPFGWRRWLPRRRRARPLRLEVSDDGRGFDADARSGGHGLRGMRERARRIGARLTIDAASGRGTRVVVEL